MSFKSRIVPENTQETRKKREELIESKLEADVGGEKIMAKKTLTEDLSPGERSQIQALHSKMVSASFGEMVTLLMKSPHYRHYNLSDLEWFLIPPLLTNQFLVVEVQLKTPASKGDEQKSPDQVDKAEAEGPIADREAGHSGVRIPIGMALWAKVSPEIDAKLSESLDSPIKLRPDEWRSGQINWLIEMIGDQQVMAGLYHKLKNDTFKGQSFKVRAQNEQGERFVKVVEAGSESSSGQQDAK